MGVFALLAGYLFWRGYQSWWMGAVLAAVFGGAGRVAPSLLRLPHRWWMKFAGLLGWVNTRILLTVFFVLVLTPVGLVMKLIRRDPLGRRFEKGSATYWERREGPAPDRSRFENEF
jgi:hypothetical protein